MLYIGRYAILSFLVIAALLLSACRPISVQPPASRPVATEPESAEPAVPVVRAVAKLDDINMYYEVHGSGEPLLLLHGGMSSGAETWQEHISALARTYKVIIPDARGHGRTTDSEQPFGYARMAEDYIKLLDRLGIEQANIVGWSDGAISGLYMLTNFPERVRALVAMEPNFTVDGLSPGMIQFATELSDATFEAEWARNWYLDIAPEPENLPVYLEKIREMWLTQPTFTTEDFAGNVIPILLISGTASDVVLPSHLQEWAASIPSVTLKNVPGATHAYPVEARESFLADALGFLAPLQPVAAPTSLLDDATVAEIEAMVGEMMEASDAPGYALGIVKDGQVVYAKGFGVERVGNDQPVNEHSVFGTGSVGKTATGTAVMQLAEAGKIDLDAPVTDYLPYFQLADARYKDITVRHLLTHRSGLPPDVADWFPLPVEYDDGALEREVRAMQDFELLFAPGAEWSYTGLGYMVLADIVAKVSGQSFEDYLQANVIEPLGMADTLLIVREEDLPEVTGNHVRGEDGQVVVSDIFPYRRQFAPASPLYSSITDMARYAAAHLNRGEFGGVQVLPAAAYDALWAPVSETGWVVGPILTPILPEMGMSWAIGEIEGHPVITHLGMDEGYGAIVALAPDDNVAVVMISNYFDPEEFNMTTWETGAEVLRMLLAKGE